MRNAELQGKVDPMGWPLDAKLARAIAHSELRIPHWFISATSSFL